MWVERCAAVRTPSLSSTKLTNNQVNKYSRRSVSGRVRCCTGLFSISKCFCSKNIVQSEFYYIVRPLRYFSWRDFPYSFFSERPLYTNPRGRFPNNGKLCHFSDRLKSNICKSTKAKKASIAPNGPCLRRCPRPTGPRAMWVERCAVAARNPEPDKNQVTRISSNLVPRAMRGQVVRCSLNCDNTILGAPTAGGPARTWNTFWDYLSPNFRLFTISFVSLFSSPIIYAVINSTSLVAVSCSP